MAARDGTHLMDLTLTELAYEIQSGHVTPLESIQAALERIDQRNPSVNAFVYVCRERALQEAREQTEKQSRGEALPALAGIPLGVKDLEDVAGLPTSYGAILFKENIAAFDSPQVERLRSAGAIVVGKTNVPIFGTQALTKNRLYGVTRNPWLLDSTSGGSSGGSAAAIAARMVPLVTASDGGGSVRIPAAFVGAFGFKGTFGLIPYTEGYQFGLQRFTGTTHQGTITRCVADAAMMVDVVCGYHHTDPLSLPRPPYSFFGHYDERPEKLRIGYVRHFGYNESTLRPDVEHQIEKMLQQLSDQGFEIVRTRLEFPDMGADWLMYAGSENFAMLDQHPLVTQTASLEKGLVESWKTVSTLSATDLTQIHRKKHAINHEISQFFKSFDLLITPAIPCAAWDAAGPMTMDFDSPMHAVSYMYPFNFTGHPAGIIRSGFLGNGTPVALQIVAERHRDLLVLQVASMIEGKTGCFEDWPSFPFPSSHLHKSRL
eukprot:TRINITY_DN8027_c0_g1_i1.p1 TRINITY_DN8027_c0_g1~~TRINITY_DN8027_c0_g1_i1.p1  ORF type:complete len:488 (-),score=94.66 TRINITY_DN8027_c0_g1_i1:20-1483(-)